MKIRLLGAVLILMCALGFSLGHSGAQQFVVKLKPGRSIRALNRAHGTQTIAQIPNTSIYLVGAGTGGQGNTILDDIQDDEDVDQAENNVGVRLHTNQQQVTQSGIYANVTAASLDNHTLTTFFGTSVLNAYVNQPALALVHANDVRGMSTGAGTRVAYIDTGVDPYHPALQPWLDPGVDLLNNSSTSEFGGLSDAGASLLDDAGASLLDTRFFSILDDAGASLLDGGYNGPPFPSALGHGTLVAGAIHAVAPNATLIPIKAFDPWGQTTMFLIIQGVYYAKDRGVDVLNMSFSTYQSSSILRKAIADASAAGVSIVAAAGNDGQQVSNVYPAGYAGVVGTGATDFNDHIASFSNYGKAVDVVATGAFVVSTAPGGKYAAAWGTSFSAPLVSGAIAVVAATGRYGHWESLRVVSTADNIDALNPGYRKQLGTGRINIRRALTN
jgi:subtilisin family serine protease